MGRSKPTEALGASWEAAAGTSAAVDLAAADVTETHPRRAEDPPRRARRGAAREGRAAPTKATVEDMSMVVSVGCDARDDVVTPRTRPAATHRMRVDIGRRDSPAGARFVVANDHVVDAREVPPLGRDETRTTTLPPRASHISRAGFSPVSRLRFRARCPSNLEQAPRPCRSPLAGGPSTSAPFDARWARPRNTPLGGSWCSAARAWSGAPSRRRLCVAGFR